MLRRSTATLTALLPVAALLLAACGDDADPTTAGELQGLDAVTISGEPGTAPEVEWKGRMAASDPETTVLSAGDGAEVANGDQVLVKIWIGNGYTQKQAFSDYKNENAELVTADDNLSPVLQDAVEGQTLGSRVAVTADATQMFGEGGNPTLGIGNVDPVLVIVDLISGVADGPDGTEGTVPSWFPAITAGDGDAVSGLDFADASEPDGRLRGFTLVKGAGARVEKGQTIVVNYLGQVFDGAQPFDESYTKEPATFQIGTGKVVKGWDRELVGRTIGSRVLLAIPPKFGYGKAGSPQAGISGTDTLYFVVDILGAA